MEVEQYSPLINAFLSGAIDAVRFCYDYTILWIDKRDEESARNDELKRSWSEPYDELIRNAYLSGELTDDEYHRRWVELWGYGDRVALIHMVDAIHSACSAHDEEPSRSWEIDSEELKFEVQLLVDEYKKSEEYIKSGSNAFDVRIQG